MFTGEILGGRRFIGTVSSTPDTAYTYDNASIRLDCAWT